MLEEVYLTSLTAVDPEPVGIWEPFCIVTIATVGVAEFWCTVLSRERLFVHLVELLHEPSGEDLNTRAHRKQIHRYHILHDN